MKKLSLLLPLLGYALNYPDFSMCFDKFKKYSIIPISAHYAITSKKPQHFVKYDPRYGIYLVKIKNKTPLNFTDAKLGMWLASIKNNKIIVGNYAELPKGDTPAKLSTKTLTGSIISDTFCHAVGIGVKGGFLTPSQIKKFITSPAPTLHHKLSSSSSVRKRKRWLNKYIFKPLGIIVDYNLRVKKVIYNTWASRHYIPVGAKIIKINNRRVYSLKNIRCLPERGKITFLIDKNGNEWTGYYKKGR